MALLSHAGAGSTDLGSTSAFNKREDISDYLLASLVPENNLLGLIDIGAEIGDTTVRWLEDRLNNNTITETDGAGNGLANASTATSTFTISAADAAIIDIGYVLVDEALPLGEQVQVTAVTGTTVTVVRAYGGTTAVVHGTNPVLRIVNSPVYENSDLGRDMSRARISKNNLISRFELNVNISQEQIVRALAGYAPGVPDEINYQFEQRMRELLRRMNNALLYSRQSSTSPASISGDYSTHAGIIAMLDGTWNATASPDATGGTFGDTNLNKNNKALFRNGALPDWIVVGANGAENLGRLYNDRIRIETNDRGRGFWAKYFDTSLGNTLRIVADNFVFDAAGIGVALLVDSGRIRIRPFKNSFFYLIQAPTFRDGDAVRAMSKWTLELRNTGTDVGAAHVFMSGLTF